MGGRDGAPPRRELCSPGKEGAFPTRVKRGRHTSSRQTEASADGILHVRPIDLPLFVAFCRRQVNFLRHTSPKKNIPTQPWQETSDYQMTGNPDKQRFLTRHKLQVREVRTTFHEYASFPSHPMKRSWAVSCVRACPLKLVWGAGSGRAGISAELHMQLCFCSTHSENFSIDSVS